MQYTTTFYDRKGTTPIFKAIDGILPIQLQPEMKIMIDDAEVRRLKTPSEFYEVYARRLAPLLADQLAATLDDRPLTLRCVEHRFARSLAAPVRDHIRSEGHSRMIGIGLDITKVGL